MVYRKLPSLGRSATTDPILFYRVPSPGFDEIWLSSDATLSADDSRLGVFSWFNGVEGLAVGDSYSLARRISLPPVPLDSFLILRTDAGGVLADPQLANNILATPLQVAPARLPDLKVSPTLSPSAADPGQKIALAWTVTNFGTGSAVGQVNPVSFSGWTDAVFLSQDPVLDALDQRLATVGNEHSPLAPSDQYTAAIDVTLPLDATGDQYLLFVADDQNLTMDDANRINNVAAAPISFTGFADLEVANADVVATDGAAAGNVSVSWTVRNSGTHSLSSTWQDAIWFSTDPLLDPSDSLLGYVDIQGGGDVLPAGAFYSRAGRFTLPGITDGFVIVQADHANELLEPQLSDNLFSVPFDVDLIRVPDLSITDPSSPVSANLGETVSVSWTVANQGTGSATGNSGWHDAVYFSTDSVLDVSDQQLSSKAFDSFDPFFNSFTPLDPSGQYSLTSDIVLPDNLVGDFFLLFVADDDRSVWDFNRNNNVAAAPISLLASDLVVSDAALLPANPLLNGDVTVSWTVNNLGTAPAAPGGWQDRIWLSADDALGQGDVLLGSVPFTGAVLSIGGQYTSSSTVTLPDAALPGTYLLIQTDADDKVLEPEESNNVRPLPLSFLLPDLTVASSTDAGAGKAGETISVTWDVTDAGAAPAGRAWSDSVYWSTDSVYDSSDVLLLQTPAGKALTVGESYSSLQTVSIPAGALPGTYHLFVVTDSTLLQPESNENNNVSSPISVDVLPDLPDLVTVQASVSPATLRLGLDFEISWTVENQGGIEAATSASPRDRIYLSHDDQFDSSDVLLADVFTTNEFPLPVGGAYQKTLAVPDSRPGQLYNSTGVNFRKFIDAGGAAGDKYVIIVADAIGNVTESAVNNNVRAVPIRFEAPDLVISSASVPATATLNQNLDISWTVTNSGNLDAIYFSQDQVYISTDEFLGGDIQLANFGTNQYRPLPVGESYTVSGTVNIANIGTGTRYLIIKADTFSQQIGREIEQREDNNYLAMPIEISAAIDLNVISSSLPSTAANGEAFTVDWTVRNDGTQAASAVWNDRIYLSTDQIVDGSDLVMSVDAVNRTSNTLAPGDSYTISQQPRIPSNKPKGLYYILIAADATNVIGETDENNNLVVHPFEIADRESVDLVVSDIVVPAVAQPAQDVTVQWTVSNQGIEPAAPDWYDRIYRVDTSGRQLLGTFHYVGAGLGVGESYTQTQQIQLANELDDGNYQIIVETDVFDDVYEGPAENNNETAADTLLSVGHVDLVPVIVAAPAAAESSETITIEWRTENRGTATTNNSWVDRVYLSVNGTSNTLLLGEITHLDPLSPGDATTLRIDATLPLELSGDWHIAVVTDASNQIWERQQNEGTANRTTQPISITLKESADLQVTNLALPTDAQPGQSITAQWTVTNLGVEPAIPPASGGQWIDRLYLYNGTSKIHLRRHYPQ